MTFRLISHRMIVFNFVGKFESDHKISVDLCNAQNCNPTYISLCSFELLNAGFNLLLKHRALADGAFN